MEDNSSNAAFANLVRGQAQKAQVHEAKVDEEAKAREEIKQTFLERRKKALPKPKFDPNFAKFEKHTKGFGMKMLEKMGFTGRLGKYEQGTSVPVVAEVRKGRGALGYYGKEVRHKNKEFERELWAEREPGSEEEEAAIQKATDETIKHGWKASRRRKRIKKVYKTAEELIADQEEDAERSEENDFSASDDDTAPTRRRRRTSRDRKPSGTIIVDMTGPRQRTIDTSKGLSASQQHQSKVASVSVGKELLYNTELVVAGLQEDILSLHRKIKTETRLTDSLSNEIKFLERAVEDRSEDLKVVEAFSQVVEKVSKCVLSTEGPDASITSTALLRVFLKLRREHPKEYEMFNIDTLARHLVPPLLSRELATTPPLSKGYARSLTKKLDPWKDLLVLEHQRNMALVHIEMQRRGSARHNPLLTNAIAQQLVVGQAVYLAIIRECVMPQLRQAIMGSGWDVKRSSETCMNCLAALKQAMHCGKEEDMQPNHLNAKEHPKFHSFVLQTVLTRLTREVEGWVPTQDPTPIHHWLLPWLPLLESELQSLFPTVRRRIGEALKRWQPSDDSALQSLTPWVGVFPDRAMHQLIVRSVAPKLAQHMRQMKIMPQNQDITPLRNVMKWQKVALPSVLVSILEAELFPEWCAVLFTWVQQIKQSDLHQLEPWLRGWMSEIPASLQKHPRVSRWFKFALQLLKARASGTPPLASFRPQLPAPRGSADFEHYMREMAQEARLQDDKQRFKHLEKERKRRAGDATVVNTMGGTVAANMDVLKFKDVVAQFAQENGVQFVPNLRRGRVDGKQLFWFGHVSCYLDKDIVFARKPGSTGSGPLHLSYFPVPLGMLLERVQREEQERHKPPTAEAQPNDMNGGENVDGDDGEDVGDID